MKAFIDTKPVWAWSGPERSSPAGKSGGSATAASRRSTRRAASSARETGDLTRLAGRLRGRLFPRDAYPGYRLTGTERLRAEALGAACALLLGLLFFSDPLALLLGLPGACVGLRLGLRKGSLRKQQELRLQLKDYLLSVSGLMRSGYALENALQLAVSESETMYGAEALMVREGKWMSSELKLRQPVMQVLGSFAGRCRLPEAEELVRLLEVARREGSGKLEVIRELAEAMESREMLRREIDTLLAGQRLEYRIMCLVPAGILLYLRLCTPELAAGLFTPGGRLFMSLALAVYLAAFLLGERILEKAYEG